MVSLRNCIVNLKEYKLFYPQISSGVYAFILSLHGKNKSLIIVYKLSIRDMSRCDCCLK